MESCLLTLFGPYQVRNYLVQVGKLLLLTIELLLGGPAEKGGLQQGDKILEWCGVSLVDRSFEEVCSIMDRTADIAELLVEHASDFRMCDLLEDNNGSQHVGLNSQGSLTNPVINVNQRKNSDVGLIAGRIKSFETFPKH